MDLSELLDLDELEDMIEQGYVTMRESWDDPRLRILNYTNACAFDRVWNPTTLACRGLIYRDNPNGSMPVLARPFEKFFNHSEVEGAGFDFSGPVSVTDKLDGCLPRSARINLWDGTTKSLGEIVDGRLEVDVVGMASDGTLVPSRVIGWHNNGVKEEWVEVSVSNARPSRHRGPRGGVVKVRLTGDHKVYANGKWTPSRELVPGDKVISRDWQISDPALHYIRSGLLGDGCLVVSRNKYVRQAQYQECHKVSHGEVVDEAREAFGPIGCNRSNTTSGYGTEMCWVGSKPYEQLYRLRQEWYPDGKKQPPVDLSWIDDYAVAKWYMDDGNIQRFPNQAPRAVFSTHSFDEESVIRLGQRLEDMYGISFHLSFDKRCNGSSLVINSGRRQQLEVFWEAIAPFVHPCMRYKLPEGFQNVEYAGLPNFDEKLVPVSREVVEVRSIAKHRSSGVGYDITTTTSNFMTDGVIVHNSCAIAFSVGGGPILATRGSFHSDQASHANHIMGAKYRGWQVPAGITVVFEVIYPENRIVVDYGDMDDLVLLGGVDIETGAHVDPDDIEWSGPRVEKFEYATYLDALAAPDRPNREGLVVYFHNTGQRVKIKQEDYKALHALISNVSTRAVWENLKLGTFDGFVAQLPDEFYDWCTAHANNIRRGYGEFLLHADANMRRVLDALPKIGWTRKDFALKAKELGVDSGATFAALDGNDAKLSEIAWRAVEPDYDTPGGMP